MSFSSLTKGITPRFCRLCVCVLINNRCFEPFYVSTCSLNSQKFFSTTWSACCIMEDETGLTQPAVAADLHRILNCLRRLLCHSLIKAHVQAPWYYSRVHNEKVLLHNGRWNCPRLNSRCTRQHTVRCTPVIWSVVPVSIRMTVSPRKLDNCTQRELLVGA